MTELPVIDDSTNGAELIVHALIDMGSIAMITPIRDYAGGVYPDRCRAMFKGDERFVLIALSYDSLKALVIEKRVKDLIMAPELS